MSAGKLDIIIEQGVDWTRVIQYNDSLGQPIPLAGFSADMQLRPRPGHPTLLLEASTVNGMIVLALGLITITLTAAVTAALAFNRGSWDLVITSPTGHKTRVLKGAVLLDPTVTK